MGKPSFAKTLSEHTDVYGCIDVVVGGFPCQDVSISGNRKGIEDGTRSGLWGEFFRLIRTIRPRYVIMENVTGLLSLGFGRVLGDLASAGYDAEWFCLQAKEFGLPHKRQRVFVVAYANGFDGNSGKTASPFITKNIQQKNIWDKEIWTVTARGSSGRVFSIPDSRICRSFDGVPGRLDRYRGLGNAVVPYCAELIGRYLKR